MRGRPPGEVKQDEDEDRATPRSGWSVEWRCAAGIVIVACALSQLKHVAPSLFAPTCAAGAGLCTPASCTCAAPLRRQELVTDDGRPCYRCVGDFCPAVTEGEANCSTSPCDCEDPKWPKVDVHTDAQSCWQCLQPSVDFIARTAPIASGGGARPGSSPASCLAYAAGEVAPAGAEGTAADAGAPPMLEVTRNMSKCIPLRFTGARITERRNRRRCLAWQHPRSCWALEACDPADPRMRFRERGVGAGTRAGMPSRVFCDGLDALQACIEMGERLCTEERGRCSTEECRCENSSWTRHELTQHEDAERCFICTESRRPPAGRQRQGWQYQTANGMLNATTAGFLALFLLIGLVGGFFLQWLADSHRGKRTPAWLAPVGAAAAPVVEGVDAVLEPCQNTLEAAGAMVHDLATSVVGQPRPDVVDETQDVERAESCGLQAAQTNEQTETDSSAELGGLCEQYKEASGASSPRNRVLRRVQQRRTIPTNRVPEVAGAAAPEDEADVEALADDEAWINDMERQESRVKAAAKKKSKGTRAKDTEKGRRRHQWEDRDEGEDPVPLDAEASEDDPGRADEHEASTTTLHMQHDSEVPTLPQPELLPEPDMRPHSLPDSSLHGEQPPQSQLQAEERSTPSPPQVDKAKTQLLSDDRQEHQQEEQQDSAVIDAFGSQPAVPCGSLAWPADLAFLDASAVDEQDAAMPLHLAPGAAAASSMGAETTALFDCWHMPLASMAGPEQIFVGPPYMPVTTLAVTSLALGLSGWEDLLREMGLGGTYNFLHSWAGFSGQLAQDSRVQSHVVLNFVDPTFAMLFCWLFQQKGCSGVVHPAAVQGLEAALAFWEQNCRIESMQLTAVAEEGIAELGFRLSGMPPGQVSVMDIEGGSWADQHAIAVGDELLGINGRVLVELEPDEMRRLKYVRPLHLVFVRRRSAPRPKVVRKPLPSQWAIDSVNAMLTERPTAQCKKTKLCTFYEQGRCEKGDRCPFAHSKDELQPTPDLAKTKLCNVYFAGRCNISRCKFAHGFQELRSMQGAPVFSDPHSLLAASAACAAAASVQDDDLAASGGVEEEEEEEEEDEEEQEEEEEAEPVPGRRFPVSQEQADSDSGGGPGSEAFSRSAGVLFGAGAPPGPRLTPRFAVGEVRFRPGEWRVERGESDASAGSEDNFGFGAEPLGQRSWSEGDLEDYRAEAEACEWIEVSFPARQR